MARTRDRIANGGERDRLVEGLARRMRDDPEARELPLVVVNRIRQTRTVHVLVIWDAWKDLSLSERGEVISRAYAAAHPDQANAVTVAMGLTPLEAVHSGYLPYRVVPLKRRGDRVPDKQILEAMASVGGVFLRAGTEVQLRFPTEKMAEDAYRALFEKIPKPIWGLVHETVAAESA
jgi:hypothetical protein